MNSAPTAEEQLPPLKIVCRNGVDDSSYMCLQVGNELLAEVFQGRVKRLQGLLDQLLAALRENREMKQRLEDEELAFSHANEVVGRLEADCAEKDARIAELEKHGNLQFEEVHNALDRAEAAEAKLRAVSDALDTLDGPVEIYEPGISDEIKSYHPAEEVDALFARIRDLVGGK